MGLGNFASPTNVWPNGGGSGGGGASQIYFAPRIIVGSVGEGDSATPYDTDGFTYIPDTGDGQAIEDALAIAALETPCWIHIRRGTYDLGTGTVADMQVPDGITLTGDGPLATFIQGRTTGNQRVFRFEGDGAIRSIGIDVNTGAVGTTGSEVILVDGGRVEFENTSINFDGNSDSDIRYALRVSSSGVAVIRNWQSRTNSFRTGLGVGIPFAHLYSVEGASSEVPFGEIYGSDIITIGGDIPFRAGGVLKLARCQSFLWREAAIEIPEGSPTADCSIYDLDSESSGAAYAGASGISVGSAPDCRFQIENARIASGTALAAGFGVNWGFSGASPGPRLIDVEFVNFAASTYGPEIVTGCYHARVHYGAATADGVSISNIESSNFAWFDVTINVDNTTGGGTGLIANGVDHLFHKMTVDVVSSSPAGAGQTGITLQTGARVVLNDTRIRINGDGGSSALLISAPGTSLTDVNVEAVADVGGSALVSVDTDGCTLKGIQAVAFAGAPSIAIDVNGNGNTVIGNQTTTDASTPGIQIDGNDNVVLGNVCHGSPSGGGMVGGVLNNGTGNEVASNISTT